MVGPLEDDWEYRWIVLISGSINWVHSQPSFQEVEPSWRQIRGCDPGRVNSCLWPSLLSLFWLPWTGQLFPGLWPCHFCFGDSQLRMVWTFWNHQTKWFKLLVPVFCLIDRRTTDTAFIFLSIIWKAFGLILHSVIRIPSCKLTSLWSDSHL